MGETYKGYTDHHYNIKENLDTAKDLFPFHENHFGIPNGKNSSNVYHIYSEDPGKTAKEFYDTIALGGKFKTETDAIEIVVMKDGTVITYRPVSKSGPAAVTINPMGHGDHGKLKYHKIHFVKGDPKNNDYYK